MVGMGQFSWFCCPPAVHGIGHAQLLWDSQFKDTMRIRPGSKDCQQTSSPGGDLVELSWVRQSRSFKQPGWNQVITTPEFLEGNTQHKVGTTEVSRMDPTSGSSR